MNGWLVALSRAKEVVEVSLRRRRPGLGTLVTAAATGCFAPELCVSALGQVPQPSRPGELHPEPLTDPDLTLSRHPARATARRLPPSS